MDSFKFLFLLGIISDIDVHIVDLFKVSDVVWGLMKHDVMIILLLKSRFSFSAIILLCNTDKMALSLLNIKVRVLGGSKLISWHRNVLTRKLIKTFSDIENLA